MTATCIKLPRADAGTLLRVFDCRIRSFEGLLNSLLTNFGEEFLDLGLLIDKH